MTISIDRFDHVVITVRDLEKSLDFYHRVLGMRIEREDVRRVIAAIKVATAEAGRTIDADHYGAGFYFRFGGWHDGPLPVLVQAYQHRFESYNLAIAGASGSPAAAVAKAARDVLVNRFPAQAATIETRYQQFLAANGLLATDPGTLTGQAARFLEAAVASGLNILVSGGTQAGKTTLLNCLCAAVPARERVITCEEVQVSYTWSRAARWSRP